MLPHKRLLTIAAFVSFAANWQFGYQITYINTASTTFYGISNYAKFKDCVNNPNHSTCSKQTSKSWSSEWSAIVSSFYPGTFLGFILVPFLVKKVGVKNSLLISTFPAIIGSIIQLFGRSAAKMGEIPFVLDLIVGRFLIGIHAGSSLCLLPLFTIETSPPSSRPFLSCLQQVFQAFSTLCGLILGSEALIPVGFIRFEFLQIIGIIPTIIFIFVLWKLPPTPFRVVDTMVKERSTEKKLSKSVKFYYGSEDYIDCVKSEAFGRWNIGTKSNWSELKESTNLKGLFIGTLAAISYSATADDLIDSYSNQILHESGEKFSELFTVIYGVILLITSIIGAFLADKFGRKRLIIYGLVGTGIFNILALIGDTTNWTFIEVIGFGLTKAAIGFGAGAPAWFLTSELVSPRITHLCQTISTGSLLTASGFMTFIYLPLSTEIGIWSLFILAILPAFFIAAILILFLPETKDKPYGEIKWLLMNNVFSGLIGEPGSHGWRKLRRESEPVIRRKTGTVTSYGTNSSINDLRVY
uniref:Major facilitator superfamily (MFS) profile domain-containing protein n=1 Tax=Panagrolaimus sp. PS1159 TaxID=55785 RepID=A0AC35FIN1_9BILA